MLKKLIYAINRNKLKYMMMFLIAQANLRNLNLCQVLSIAFACQLGTVLSVLH
jgi:hypothetical protein